MYGKQEMKYGGHEQAEEVGKRYFSAPRQGSNGIPTAILHVCGVQKYDGLHLNKTERYRLRENGGHIPEVLMGKRYFEKCSHWCYLLPACRLNCVAIM